ncbi:unnamed protein product [Bathycoccus prasinos]
MMTLLLLLFGTISDVFVVRATWPIVRYKNGTVGVKNDGGTVKVQSTDLIVDGNLSVSGSLFVQDRDLAEYEERVSSLETSKTPAPPVCQPPGGDKLQFDGEKWTCVCVSEWWSGDSCETPPPWIWKQRLGPIADQNVLVAFKGNSSVIAFGSGKIEAFNLTQNGDFVMKSDESDIFPHTPYSHARDWNQHAIVGDYAVVGSSLARFYIAGAWRTIGIACVLKRKVDGEWIKEKELTGCYSNYKGTYCSYGGAQALGIKDSHREFVVLKNGFKSCSRCSGTENAPEIKTFVSSGTSTTWTTKQSILLEDWMTSVGGTWGSIEIELKTIRNILLNDFATATRYFMVVHVSHHSIQSSGISQEPKEEIRLYSNAAPGADASEWVFETSWFIYGAGSNVNLALTFSGADILVAAIGAWEKTPWPGSENSSDYAASKCAHIKVYDLNTKREIQTITLPQCAGHVTLQASKDVLVVGNYFDFVVYVYEHSKEAAGVFVHVDTLKAPDSPSTTRRASTPSDAQYDARTDVYFGQYVAINANNDILVYASQEESVNATRGVVHRFQRREQSVTSPPPTDSVTINGKQLYQDSDGWILLLAYEHKAGENNAFVSKTAPSSPTEGYSHIWLEDLGLAASDVDSVKFYCKTSAHSRVMHFSSSMDWVKNAIVTGTYADNQVSYRTSGTTKFSDHTANLPDATKTAAYNDLTNSIFYLSNTYHWGMKIQGSRWECDDFARNTADTLHQIWFKRKSSSGA